MLAVNEIYINRCTSAQAQSLSAYLAAHASAAPIDSIDVSGRVSSELPVLELPVERLIHLRYLQLYRVQVVPSQLFSTPALTSLTSVAIDQCNMQLDGLGALTSLQSLFVDSLHGTDVASDKTALAAAIPQLTTNLTSLRLSGAAACTDAVLANVSRLTALEELGMLNAHCSAASFQSLPVSLTALTVTWRRHHEADIHAAQEAGIPVLSPSSAPGVAALTSLKRLWVAGCRVHPALLANHTALQDVDLAGVSGDHLAGAADGAADDEEKDAQLFANLAPAEYASITAADAPRHQPCRCRTAQVCVPSPEAAAQPCGTGRQHALAQQQAGHQQHGCMLCSRP